MNTIVVVDQSTEFASKIDSLLAGNDVRIEHALSVGQADELASRDAATVIVVGPSVPLEDASFLAGWATRSDRAVAAVAVLPSVDTEIMRRAMRAGFQDVLSATAQTWAEVASAVLEAHRSVLVRRSGANDPSCNVKRGRVVAVMGTKGGVGKSVIATNLAAALASEGQSVVLVDLDLASGDDGIMMKLEPARTIRDAVAASDRLDVELLEGFLTPHSSGVRVLLAPARPEDAETVTASRVARILELLRETADLIVVDTPSAWDEATLAAADASDSILAVTGMELTSIKDTSVMLSRLAQLGRGNGTVKVVLNRADSKVLIEEKDVERALGRSIVSRVPSDRLVPRSVNKGTPLVMDAPRSGVAKAVIDLARSITKNGVNR